MHRGLCDFLTEIFQNSVEAGSQAIRVQIFQNENSFAFVVSDNGKGIDNEILSQIQNPFHTGGTKHFGRKVSLGIPLLIQTVQMTDSRFYIRSCRNHGTTVGVKFNLVHWDIPPLGDLVLTLSQMMAWEGDFELSVLRQLKSADRMHRYQAKRSELQKALVNLQDLTSQILLKEFFLSNETECRDKTEEKHDAGRT